MNYARVQNCLMKTERLLELQPKNNNATQLKKQLEDRTSELRANRKYAHAAAQDSLENQDYSSTLKHLSGIDEMLVDKTTQTLKEEAESALHQLRELKSLIRKRLKLAAYEGLVSLIEEGFNLQSDDPELLQLRGQLHADVDVLLDDVARSREWFDFGEAVQTLRLIPADLLPNSHRDAADEARRLHQQREIALSAVEDAIHNASTETEICDLLSPAQPYLEFQHVASDQEFYGRYLVAIEKQKHFRVFEEAQQHRAAFDYQSAIHALQSVPEAMRTTIMSVYLQQLESDQAESDELIETISERVQQRDLRWPAGAGGTGYWTCVVIGSDLWKMQWQLTEKADPVNVSKSLASFSALTFRGQQFVLRPASTRLTSSDTVLK